MYPVSWPDYLIKILAPNGAGRYYDAVHGANRIIATHLRRELWWR